MKDAYYLKHDTNAHRDPKMMRLRAKWGNEGYGAFWILAEVMRDQDWGRLLLEDAEVLGLEIRFEKLPDLIQDCCDWGIFESDETQFWSPRMVRDMQNLAEVRESKRQAGSKGGKATAEKQQKRGSGKPKAKQRRSSATAVPQQTDGDDVAISGDPILGQEEGQVGKEEQDNVQNQDGQLPEWPDVPPVEPKANGYRFSESDFLAFYDAYPKSENKIPARKKYRTVRKSGVTQEQLLDGLKRFKEHHKAKGTDEQYICAPNVWLNGGKWENEYNDKAKPQYSGTQEEMREQYKESF
jgi:hypothetical protein